MSKTLRGKLRIFAAIFLITMMVGIGSSAVPAASGISTDQLIAAGTIDSAIALGGGTVAGNFVSFDVASVDLASVDLSQVPSDMLPFVEQTIADVNSGALTGTVDFDLTGVDIYSSVESVEVPVDFRLGFNATEAVAMKLNGRNGTDGAILAAAAKRSGVVSTLNFSTTARVGRGFSSDNPVLASVPSRSSVGLGFQTAASNKSKHATHADRWVVPGVGFRGGDITVQNAGKTPKALRDFDNNKVGLDSSAIQFDAVSRTISARHQFSIKKKGE